MAWRGGMGGFWPSLLFPTCSPLQGINIKKYGDR